MPLQATSGAASYDAFGGGVAVVPAYIEEVFSSYLYEGNGTTQQIVNGIDLSTKGGLVWTKSRSNAFSHMLIDTVRTSRYLLNSNTTGAQADQGSTIANFNTDGYTFTASGNSWNTNNYTNNLYVGWTFRKQPKFFDVVTYTGAGSVDYSHSLGSVPGFALYKATNGTSNWNCVCRKSDGTYELLQLNTTTSTFATYANAAAAGLTSTTFNPSPAGSATPSTQFVAYLFAHDAGGFGLTGTDNVISCGSFTGSAKVNLGYEPQLILYKTTNTTGDWSFQDNMRGMTADGNAPFLRANSSAAEVSTSQWPIDSTGFTPSAGGNTYIYIAIRRGPMKVPTTGTSVFAPLIIPINSASATVPINAGLTTDLVFGSLNSDESGGKYFASRLTANYRVNSTSTAAEALGEYYWDNMVGVRQQETNAQPTWYFFKRAPSCFDEVCFIGTGSAITINHNLGVIPEIIITKKRIDNTGSGAAGWIVMSSAYSGGFISGGSTSFGQLQSTAAIGIGAGSFLQSTPTSTTIPLLGANYAATDAFVVYLFATCAGVSKVGSYTGTATTKQIDCGFTGGARFVLIKRTDSTGDWYVWDTARGIVAGNDPYLLLNSTAAEVTNTDYIDPYSAGFEISSTAPAAINASGGTYIFLAIA